MGEKRKRSDDSYSEAEVAVETLEETPEKRIKVESVEPSTPKPLTRKNLALLEGKMPRSKNAKAVSNNGSGSGNTSKPATTKSTSEERSKAAKTVSSNAPSKNLAETKRNFEKNRLFINDHEALKRHKAIMDEAKKVINETRESAMKEDEREKFAERRDTYEFWPEADFIAQIWQVLILESRTMRHKQPVPDEEDATEMILKAWDKSGLALTRGSLFQTDCLPKVDTEGDAMLEALLNLLPRVANPKPDLAYGLLDSLFTQEERTTLDYYKNLTRLSSLFYNTFCIMEFKGYQGTIQEAELQACRGGSAMVNAMRELKIKVHELDRAHAYDVGSFSWSIAMIPSEAELFVHWAEECEDGKVSFHMNRVADYRLRDGRDAAELRKHINNVLDWGLELRLDYMKAMARKLKQEFLKPGSLAPVGAQEG